MAPQVAGVIVQLPPLEGGGFRPYMKNPPMVVSPRRVNFLATARSIPTGRIPIGRPPCSKRAGWRRRPTFFLVHCTRGPRRRTLQVSEGRKPPEGCTCGRKFGAFGRKRSVFRSDGYERVRPGGYAPTMLPKSRARSHLCRTKILLPNKRLRKARKT
jgi:hypothetical protein